MNSASREVIEFRQRGTMEADEKPRRFSREEAEAKLGRRVRSVSRVENIPVGTGGYVTQVDEIEKDGFELIIEWDSLLDGKRQHDWFAKDQYVRCLSDDSN